MHKKPYRKIFTEFNFPLQVIAVLLLVATVGCVALSKKATVIAAKAPSKRHIPMITAGSAPEVKSAKLEKPVEHVPAIAEAEVQVEEKPVEKSVPETPTNTSTDEKRGLIYNTRPDDADDLKVISDVGPVLETKLNDFGIYTYKQVADWSESNIEEFDDLLSFKGRIIRDDWLTQATELQAKKNA